MRSIFGFALGLVLGCSSEPGQSSADDPPRSASPARLLKAQGNHACLVTNDQAVWCWGSTSITGATLAKPTQISGTGSRIESLFVTDYDACVTSSDSDSACFGDIATRYLQGKSVSAANALVPAPLGVSGSGSISGDQSALIAVASDGSLWGVGDGRQGQLGPSGSAPFSAATKLDVEGQFSAVASGCGATCALETGGKLQCFGTMPGGFPTGTPLQAPPLSVDGLPSARAVAVGCGFACALVDSGAVWCWGSSSVTAGVAAYPPVVVAGLPAVSALATGADHACALDARGVVWCWGDNSDAELGHGSSVMRGTPAAVPGISGATRVAAGAGFSCALLQDSNVACWGSGDQYQLGNGTRSKSALPTTVQLEP